MKIGVNVLLARHSDLGPEQGSIHSHSARRLRLVLNLLPDFSGPSSLNSCFHDTARRVWRLSENIHKS